MRVTNACGLTCAKKKEQSSEYLGGPDLNNLRQTTWATLESISFTTTIFLKRHVRVLRNIAVGSSVRDQTSNPRARYFVPSAACCEDACTDC